MRAVLALLKNVCFFVKQNAILMILCLLILNFLSKKQENSLFLDGPVIYTEYVIACLDCFTFQLWNLSIEDIRIFDTVDCRFTHSDPFSFSVEYCDDIYTGNVRFAVENALLTFEEREVLFRKGINIRDHFFRQPTGKTKV